MIPRGPCANLCCHLSTCHNCACGGLAELHSVYSPLCTAVVGAGGFLFLDGKKVQPAVEICAATLQEGRDLWCSTGKEDHAGQNSTGDAQATWQTTTAEIRAAMGSSLLPTKMVLCQKCFWTFEKMAEDLKNDGQRGETARRKQQEHVQQTIRNNIAALFGHASLPFLLALCSLVTLFAWLAAGTRGMSGNKPSTSTTQQSRVWRSVNELPRRVDPSKPEKGNWKDGTVSLKTSQSKMAASVGMLARHAFDLCTVPFHAFVALKDAFGGLFWEAAGDLLHAELQSACRDQVEAIKDNRLHSLTDWGSDFASTPLSLQAFMLHATASRQEV